MNQRFILLFLFLPLFPIFVAYVFSNFVFVYEEPDFDSLLMESYKNMHPRWWAFGQSESEEPRQWHQPATVQEIVAIVSEAAERGERVKVVGAGHSFSPIGLTTGRIMNLDRLRLVLDVDEISMQVTVQAGIRLRDLNRQLGTRGLALENIGSIDAQSLGGAISTSTHGSGIGFSSMSTKVVWMELVLANGSLLNVSKETEELFAASLNGLGLLGIITTVRLQCVKDYNVIRRDILVGIDHVIDSWSEYVEKYDHFTYFWIPYTESAKLFLMTRTDTSVSVNKSDLLFFKDYGGVTAGKMLMLGWWSGSVIPSVLPWITRYYIQPLLGLDLNYVDNARDGLKLESPASYSEMEYFVSLENYTRCFRDLKHLIETSDEFRVNFVVQTRFSAADSVWLSPMYREPKAAIAVMTIRQDDRAYFNKAELIFKQYGGRTHWGKRFTANGDYFRKVYERFDDFLAVRKELDPSGMFLNEYFQRIFL
ncbi:L-gulono-1,4-lactone dehydrogenase-like [Corticium candelabrum]|uniref:L-gulono-1,4-lactone dehydrogenase-like n=1 Tax=Corticium candelabrum TaxID=121492 RepID=UPI002E256D05|nr:L-gulono-1,4-lactone dehydrogenase-like [Corticium candelabrum]